MSVGAVYNFEAAFEPALGVGLLNKGLTVYTSQGKIKDDGTLDPSMDLTKDRPRVEVVFVKGGSIGHLHLKNDTDKYTQAVLDAWRGTYRLSCITEADPSVHFNYLAQIRYLCSTIPDLIDGTLLQNHVMNFPVIESGETHRYEPQSGIFVTTMGYEFTFSIHTSAWALLNTP